MDLQRVRRNEQDCCNRQRRFVTLAKAIATYVPLHDTPRGDFNAPPPRPRRSLAVFILPTVDLPLVTLIMDEDPPGFQADDYNRDVNIYIYCI